MVTQMAQGRKVTPGGISTSHRRGHPKSKQQRVFLLAYEGKKTEPRYFDGLKTRFRGKFRIIPVKFDGRSDPADVLQRMEDAIKQRDTNFDEAWIVVDTDDRPKVRLQPVCEWQDRRQNYCVAWSHPKFEYWLVLHYTEEYASASGKKGVKNVRGGKTHPRRSEDYKKIFEKVSGYRRGRDLPDKLFDGVEEAIRRSEARMLEVGDGWPDVERWTTVHRLVKRMIK